MHETQESRQNIARKRKRSQRILIVAVVVVILGIVLLLPRVRRSLGYRLDDLRTRVTYWLNPPDEAVFVPEGSPSSVRPAATYFAFAAAARPTWDRPLRPPTSRRALTKSVRG